MHSALAAKAILQVAQGLFVGQTPEVPSALLDAAKPLCSASCHQHLVGCKSGGTGQDCEKTQTTSYTKLFSYICSKEKVVQQDHDTKTFTSCDSADLYTFPSEAEPTGEVVYLKFDKQECTSDLDKVMNSETA